MGKQEDATLSAKSGVKMAAGADESASSVQPSCFQVVANKSSVKQNGGFPLMLVLRKGSNLNV